MSLERASHLLLVLLALAQLGQAAFHFHTIPAKDLEPKLAEKPLTADEVFGLIDRVKGKKSIVNLGATNLRLLLNLDEVKTTSCIGDTFEERLATCESAKTAHIDNVDNYCRDRLNKLARHCAEEASVLVKASIFDENFGVLNFFRDMMRGHFKDARDKDESLIDAYLGGEWRGAEATLAPEVAKKAEKLYANCSHLTGDDLDLKNLVKIFSYASQEAGVEPKLDTDSEGWLHVHDMCKLFLAKYKK